TARAIAARAPEFVNDPTESTWELIVTRDLSSDSRDAGAVDLAIEPRGIVDPRFTWRRGDLRAASHPTLAAALARVAGVRDDDVVWDPFAGSGAELVERALLGPYRTLVGGDIDAQALEVARENLAAAGLTARLEERDVLAAAPEGVTLVITNPPMGRRAARSPGLDALLDRFVGHAAAPLAPGGRLVWLAPWPQRSRPGAARSELCAEIGIVIASVALLVSSRKIWLFALVFGAASAGVILRTYMHTSGLLEAANQKIALAQQRTDEIEGADEATETVTPPAAPPASAPSAPESRRSRSLS